MTNETRLRYLALVLRIFGPIMLVIFLLLFFCTATDSALMQPGGALVWMRWEPFSKHVELMLYIVYITWAVFIIRASRDPRRYLSFLDFTAWANLSHGLLMLGQTFVVEHHMHKLYTDDFLTIVLAGLIFWLRPQGLHEETARGIRAT